MSKDESTSDRSKTKEETSKGAHSFSQRSETQTSGKIDSHFVEEMSHEDIQKGMRSNRITFHSGEDSGSMDHREYNQDDHLKDSKKT